MIKCGLYWRIWARKMFFRYRRMMITKEGGGPRRENLRGDSLSMEGGGPRRETSWRDSLHGENNQGEMIFKERISLWRDSSRRE
jgi:hypothetical protein